MNKLSFIFILLLFLPLTSAITGSIGNSVIVANTETGEIYRNYILIRNSNTFPVTIILTPEPNIAEEIDFDEDTFIVPAGEDKRAYFNFTSDVEGTFSGNVDVKFQGNGEQRTLSAILTFIVEEGDGSDGGNNNGSEEIAEIEAFLDSEAFEGEELIIIAEITNIKDESASFTVEVENYENWAELADNSDNEIEIGSGETEEVVFTFDNVSAGNHSFTIKVTSGGVVQTKEIEIHIQEEEDSNEAGITAIVKNPLALFTGNLGDEFEKEFTVINNNNFAVNIDIFENSPNIAIDENSFELEPGEERNITYTATITRIGTTEHKINVTFNAEGKNSIIIPVTIKLTGQQNLRADAAYIVRNLNGVDMYLLNELEDLGYSYETILENQVAGANLSEFRFVIIGNQDLSNPSSIPIEKHKTLLINSYNYYKSSTSNYQFGWSAAKSSTTNPAMKVVNLDGSITSGVSDQFRSYTTTSSNTYILKGQKPTGYSGEASLSGLSSDVVIASLDKGKRFLNGKTLEERQVFFGIVNAQYWTEDSKKLFDNSIDWLLVGEDRDGDQYFSDVDCNDNNSNVNPGENEIPYDNLDNDCEGGDLKDVDGDGFDSDLAGGMDCDDEDDEINPENADPYLNCINDAPIVQNISKIILMETQTLEITVSAIDPEGDILTYSIDDSRFTNNGNSFTWQTTAEDQGNYEFTVFISDSEFTVDRDVEIEITKFNREPTLENIPEIEWNEDDTFTLDLNDYFNDPDGDNLAFGINSTSNDKNITVEFAGEGIFRFIPAENWNGEDWIVFYASDGDKRTNSNKAILRVNPVNDPVEFEGKINAILWDEDENAENVFNLYDYFIDVDSDELVFDFDIDEKDIAVSVVDGVVSFSSEKDFNGEASIVFSAADSESTATSNIVQITVVERGEVPDLKELRCAKIIDEDAEYECELIAEDFENDTINFIVKNENNLECKIEDNILAYKSKQDYFGNASCDIAAKDKDGESAKKLEVTINAVNDAPSIAIFNPIEDSIVIIEGRERTFSINAEDIDSDIDIEWKVNGAIRKVDKNTEASSYKFNEQQPGFYVIEAEVSDNEYSSVKAWSVIVGDTSEFTCSEVGGFNLNEDLICNGDLINVKDTGSCCTMAGLPSFSDADACEIVNESVRIEIEDPDGDDDIEIGENIEVEIRMENNLDEEQDFDVEAHLYNLKDDNSESSNDISFEIDEGKTRTLKIELEIPGDLDLDDNYALFVKADDSVCSQTYQEIRLERPDDNVEIRDFEAGDSFCGGEITVSTKVKNVGDESQDVKIRIRNDELNINFESEVFELEEFEEDDTETKEFVISVPGDAEPGRYNLDLFVEYAGNSERESKEVNIDCVGEQIIQNNAVELELPQDSLRLNFARENEVSKTSDKRWVAPILLIFLIAVILILVLLFVSSRSQKRRIREQEDIKILKKKVFQAE